MPRHDPDPRAASRRPSPRRPLVAAALACGLGVPHGASADCVAAAKQAEDAWRIPPGLLLAIGRVESGRRDPATGALAPWPWTTNAEGEGRYFDGPDAAVSHVQALQARGVRSVDVGCFQVNLRHHPGAFANLADGFDPARNADYAARFLASLYAQTGDWPAAAARYHSATPGLADAYLARVLASWGSPSVALSSVWSTGRALGGSGPLAPAVVRVDPPARPFAPEAVGRPSAPGLAPAPRAVVPIAYGVRVIGPGGPAGPARPGLPRVFVPGQAR